MVLMLTSYREQYDDLKEQLDSYKKEKKKYSRLFAAICVTTGISVITCVVLIVLVILKIL